jgi:hypothetical protein
MVKVTGYNEAGEVVYSTLMSRENYERSRPELEAAVRSAGAVRMVLDFDLGGL